MTRHNASLLVLVLAAVSILHAGEATTTVDPQRMAVLRTVQTLLDGWREADPAKLEAALHPDFREVTLHLQDGKWNFAIEGRDRLINTMTRIAKGAWDDQLVDPEIHVDGPIAVVWSHYKFTVRYTEDGVAHSPSHCGVETFQLYRTDTGWKIVNFADTHADTCVAQALLPAGSGVGEVSFANTGAEAAQPAFLRGLALLHDFEYPSAADSFREAQKIDPAFVMAYWGEAMTYTHPVWYQQDADAARAVLQRLGSTAADRAAKAKSDRERAYLQTIEVLYGDGSKDERDFKYADAMAALHQRYPDDVDATAFYALALLGTSHNGRDTATYMRAAALLEDVFPTHQHHPGVLHYLIHSYDDPVHAPLGMRAARLYGAVAPDAGHALHMTSHIFIAMGMWDDVIDANVRALAVVNAHRAATGKSAVHCGHYETWLHYALLQKHRNEEARKMLDACRADAFNSAFKGGGGFDTEEGRINAYADMVASQVMSGVPLDDAERASPAEKFVDARFTLAYADAFDAYRRGDAAALRDAPMRLRAFQKAKEAAHPDPMNMYMNMNPNSAQRMAVVIQEVDAMQMAAAGHREDAVAALRKAAAAEQAMPFDFGPPYIEKPTLELLGDQLLAMKRTAEAAEAYRAALARTPGRSSAAEGLRNTSR